MTNGNITNLVHVLSADEQRRGGVASGEARRRRKALREALYCLLDADIEQDGQTMLGVDAVALAVFTKALAGDIRAAEFLRDSTDGRPRLQVDVGRGISDEARAEMDALLKSFELEG